MKSLDPARPPKNLARLYVFLLFALVSLSCIHAKAYADCTTHFVNKSDVPWSITGQNGNSPPLVTPPNATTEINWGAVSTRISLQGALSGHPYTISFRVQRNANCYVIVPERGIGFIQINRPTMGDVTICTGLCVGSAKPN